MFVHELHKSMWRRENLKLKVYIIYINLKLTPILMGVACRTAVADRVILAAPGKRWPWRAHRDRQATKCAPRSAGHSLEYPVCRVRHLKKKEGIEVHWLGWVFHLTICHGNEYQWFRDNDRVRASRIVTWLPSVCKFAALDWVLPNCKCFDSQKGPSPTVTWNRVVFSLLNHHCWVSQFPNLVSTQAFLRPGAWRSMRSMRGGFLWRPSHISWERILCNSSTENFAVTVRLNHA